MASIKKGDALGDCPECGAKDAVLYRGNNEGVCKSCGLVCEVELEEGEHEAPEPQPEIPAEVAADPTPEPVPPPAPVATPEPEAPATHVPKPVEPVVPQGGTTEAPTSFATPQVDLPPEPSIGQTPAEHAPPKVVIEGVEPLKEVVGASLKIDGKLELKTPANKAAASELKIPNYVQRSRPWKWAHEMGNNGNPYKHATKSYEIFHMISHGETNIPRLIAHLYEQKPEVCDKPNILLTVYEVVTQCIAAGLLLMHPETGMLMVCQGPPKPHSMP